MRWMVPNREARIEGRLVSEGSRHEPFCTVLLEQVSESIGVSKGQFARQTRRPDLPSRNRADPDTVCPAAPVVFIKLQWATGCVRINGTSSGPAKW
jgi:hypothetical protein